MQPESRSHCYKRGRQSLISAKSKEAHVVYQFSVRTQIVRPGFDPRRGMPLSKAVGF